MVSFLHHDYFGLTVSVENRIYLSLGGSSLFL